MAARAAAEFLDKLEREFEGKENVRIEGIGIVADLRYTNDDGVTVDDGSLYCTSDSRVYQRGLFDMAQDIAIEGDRPAEDQDEGGS